MTMHLSPAMIARYANRDAHLDEVTMWSVEVHLEACPQCRAQMGAGAVDDTRARLDRIAAVVGEGIAAGPRPAPRRRLPAVLSRWAVWQLAPWLSMTAAVLACAVLLDEIASPWPSLVALLAPVAPLPGVAVAWSRRLDPAWELIASTPAAGLTVLLRRTLAVLVVVVPALTVASSSTGISVTVTLLPCLAFTAATIALGAFVGVRRAAAGLGIAWVVAVVAPALYTFELPALLEPGSARGWALLTVVLAGFAATRTGAFRRLSGLT